jgi:hypothetical protein
VPARSVPPGRHDRDIASGAVIAGSLPGRALRLVRERIEEHRDELEVNWERAVRYQEPEPIEPLR